MLPCESLIDAFHYLDRDTLDAAQLVCAVFRDAVVVGSKDFSQRLLVGYRHWRTRSELRTSREDNKKFNKPHWAGGDCEVAQG